MRIAICGGRLIDPANRIDARLNLLIENGRVRSVTPEEPEAELRIDAAGKVVCPGFVDIHMHEDPVDNGHIWDDPEKSIFSCMLRMGVTTAVGGNCGENKYHPADYLDLADRDGTAVNVAMLAGHGYFRQLAGCANPYGPASREQRSMIAQAIDEALRRGCLGVSYGVRYTPGMDMSELLETAEPCARRGKLVAAHIRDDAAQVFSAAREFLDAGLRLNTPLELSHIGSMAGFGQMEEFLALVDSYRAINPHILCDCYPYDVFSTSLGSATYDEGWLERYGCGYDAVELAEGPYKGRRCTEELFRRQRRDFPGCMTLCSVMRQEEVDLAYRHPGVMLGSDGTLNRGQGHPRAAGAFPRFLARYVRGGRMDLYDAIERMTAMPAGQLGIVWKGRLGQGADGDVVVFDPERIEDRASFADPLLPPKGIDWVLVGGVPAVRDGVILNGKAGRSVRKF